MELSFYTTVLILNALLLPLLTLYLYHNYLSNPPTKKPNLPPMTITALRIHPIKSCRGISVPRALLKPTGLDLDRQWMFIDSKTREFMTIRQVPEMTLVDVRVDEGADELVVRFSREAKMPDGVEEGEWRKETRVPAHPGREWLEENTTLITDAKIWGAETDAWAYPPELSAPFTKFFGREVTFLYKGPSKRFVGGGKDKRGRKVEHSVNFPDMMPVLVANEHSLEELNGRLAEKGLEKAITVERFRPNVIVRGVEGGVKPEAWSEDKWTALRITPPKGGEKQDEQEIEKPVDIEILSRCARCQVPNVDPDTAVKHRKEPWDTLVSYRRVDEGIKYKPCFGMLGVLKGEEGREVRVGMRMDVMGVREDEWVFGEIGI